MNINEIIEFLEENQLKQIEEIQYKDSVVVLRFYYDFDKDELSAAKSFANEESDYDEESEEWYGEYLMPFLNDMAVDNVSDIIEEVMDEFELQGQFISGKMDRNNFSYNQFIAAFTMSDDEIDINEILDELDS